MSGQPGRLQTTFNALELGPRLIERSELKYFQTGAARAENVEALPQGGFSVRQGLRHIASVPATAERIVAFRANDGSVFDIVLSDSLAQVYGMGGFADTTLLATFTHPYTSGQLLSLDWAQQLDTLLMFHPEVAPQRALFNPLMDTWSCAAAPLANLPVYDYGATYTNGVAAVWDLEFVGMTAGSTVFTLTLNGQETSGIKFAAAPNTWQGVLDALGNLGLIKAGYTVAMSGGNVRVTFSGAGNLGDEWALAGRVVNKADAAVVAFKVTAGVEPGEPVISATRGWPATGVFYQQRLLMGGFESLPAAWMASISGEFYNFSQKIKDANGSFLVVLDAPGGERVRRIVNNQFLLVMTSNTNYWVAGSQDGLSKLVPPRHVPASDHGVAAGAPVVQNEGAAIYIHSSGDFVGELRYTDVDGNYAALDVSLLAYHLIEQARDIAIRKKQSFQAANMLSLVNGDGSLRLAMLLREQDVTGFSRVESGCPFHATACNGNNDLTTLTQRAGTRRLERFEPGLLLDAAISWFGGGVQSSVIGGVSHLEGQEVWALADGHVFGPLTVTGGVVTLPRAVISATVGVWRPPVITTLPLPRERAEGVVVKRKGRIHTLHLNLEDTTSLAVQVNGGKLFDVDLRRFGGLADVPELNQGFTGTIKLSGFTGWTELPQVTITQLRPGRLTVRSLTTEAWL
jgi:hypothetical protein